MKKGLLLVVVAGMAAPWVFAGDISLGFAPSATKVMRDANPAGMPQTWELAAARNEVEACQLVLASDVPAEGVTVKTSPMTAAKGSGVIPLELFKVEYVPAKQAKEDRWPRTDTLGATFYGDGLLLYPSQKDPSDGPVGSLRLEVLRDSLEDFDYLTLADRLLGPNVTRSYIAKVARSSTDYQRDPVQFEKVRRELGAALEKAGVPPR
jgi:hypothetical protein